MATGAWGDAWGGFNGAWNGAWGAVDGGAPPAVPGDEVQFGTVWGYLPRRRRRRKEREYLSERQAEYRAGLAEPVAKIIEAVAQRQVADTHLDEGQRVQELLAELKAEQIQWDQRYLTALEARREFLRDQEIATLLWKKVREDEEMLMAVVVTML